MEQKYDNKTKNSFKIVIIIIEDDLKGLYINNKDK